IQPSYSCICQDGQAFRERSSIVLISKAFMIVTEYTGKKRNARCLGNGSAYAGLFFACEQPMDYKTGYLLI
ncbi:MAG: hypothetical protein IKE31_05285, partial [Eubacterium sp.]|nr:hypothetical protein [Eubacterium sp.]